MSGLHRSNVYYEPVPESAEDLRLMRLIEEEYLRHPHLGSRGMVLHLARQGEVVNRKRMQRLLRKMGLQPLAPRPSTTRRAVSHKVYPYLLRSIEVVRPNQVWACDITYVGKKLRNLFTGRGRRSHWECFIGRSIVTPHLCIAGRVTPEGHAGIEPVSDLCQICSAQEKRTHDLIVVSPCGL